MLKWLERAMPHAGVDADNPLFKYEVRRIRWGATAEQLSRYSLIIFAIVQLLIWILWNTFMYASGNQQATLLYAAVDKSSEFVRALFFGSLGATILLDLSTLLFALRSLDSEVITGLPDLIRLSSVPMADFVSAKHAVLRIRAGMLMPILLSIRLGVVTLLCYSWFFLIPETEGAVLYPMLFIVTSGYLALFVAEPLWRIRAFTAVYLALIAILPSLVWVIWVAMAAIIMLWGIQFGLAVLLWNIARSINSISFIFCFGLLSSLFIGWIFYSFFELVQKWSLRIATNSLEPN